MSEDSKVQVCLQADGSLPQVPHAYIESLVACLARKASRLERFETRCAAAEALAALAQIRALRTALADAALPALVRQLQPDREGALQYRVAAALEHLAEDEDLRLPIADAALPGLVHLLKMDVDPHNTQAAATLCALAHVREGSDNDSVKQLIAATALPAITSLLNDVDMPEGRVKAAELLSELLCPLSVSQIAADALPGLIKLLRDTTHPQGRIQAAFTLGDLLKEVKLDENLLRVVVLPALPALVSLLEDPTNIRGRTAAARALCSMHPTSYTSLQETVADAALPALVSIVRLPADHLRMTFLENNMVEEAAKALACLTCSDEQSKLVVDATWPLLCSLLQTTWLGGVTALSALRSLMRNEHLAKHMSAAALPTLASKLRIINDVEEVGSAIFILDKLAAHDSLRAATADAALPALVSLLEDCDADAECRGEAAECLAELAENDHLKKPIADAALPALVGLLQSSAEPADPDQLDLAEPAATCLLVLAGDGAIRQRLAAEALPALSTIMKEASAEEDVPESVEALFERLTSEQQ